MAAVPSVARLLTVRGPPVRSSVALLPAEPIVTVPAPAAVMAPSFKVPCWTDSPPVNVLLPRSPQEPVPVLITETAPEPLLAIPASAVAAYAMLHLAAIRAYGWTGKPE